MTTHGSNVIAEFQNYGDGEVRGRDNLVIEEQVHGLALPGRKLAPIKNMALYRLRDGRIVEWRDHSDSAYARTLL
ncbi:hypothetical protein AB0M61_17235 [Streptomyces sp. NPDC051642]|uniref:hypothetical protein n=1 Tax=Streptomyces sp. NPDC051642 TaxID=3154646 RepID=UPI00343217A1